jgi:hypothetical protein
VGGQDEVVFEGRSFALQSNGNLATLFVYVLLVWKISQLGKIPVAFNS